MKYLGKEKCKKLKQIRAEIARKNGINCTVSECHNQGDCLGTCPRCEHELRELEKQLEERRKTGQRVVIAGVAATISLVLFSGCDIGLDKVVEQGFIDMKGVTPDTTDTYETNDDQLIETN